MDIYSEILQHCLNNKYAPSIKYINNNPQLLEELIKLTTFLPTESTYQQRLWHIRHNNFTPYICDNIMCSNPIKWTSTHGYNNKIYCSKHCFNTSDTSKQKRERTNIEKFGVKNAFQNKEVQEKYKTIFKEKYDVDNPSHMESVIEKRKRIFLKNYGVDNPLKVDSIKERIKNTNIQKYGHDTVFKSPEIKEKIRLSLLNKFNVDNPTYIGKDLTPFINLNEYDFVFTEHVTNEKPLIQIAAENHCSDATVGNYMRKHGISTIIRSNISYEQQQLMEFLNSFNIVGYENDETQIKPKQLDIFIPSHNLAIEYNGVYYHSESKVANNYHKIKYDMCKEKGIRLISIFSDEWIHNTELVKKKLLHILGISIDDKIFARKCITGEVPILDKTSFFDANHIQGNGPSSINLGLYRQTDLVAVMGFIKKQNNVYNLSRYATSKNVVGGFSKLLSHFEKTYLPNQIYTFADLRWSEGDLYHKSGFTLDTILSPDYSYVVNNKRIHKFNFRHKHLSKRLKTYDSNLSEHQNCLNNGIYRIYDCGKLKFVKNYN